MVSGAVVLLIGIVLLAKLVVGLWPTLAETDTDIQALTSTDIGTTSLQTMWPIVLMVVGIGIAVGAIFMALRKSGIMKA